MASNDARRELLAKYDDGRMKNGGLARTTPVGATERQGGCRVSLLQVQKTAPLW